LVVGFFQRSLLEQSIKAAEHYTPICSNNLARCGCG
jgi:hypothetical protein